MRDTVTVPLLEIEEEISREKAVPADTRMAKRLKPDIIRIDTG